MKPERAGEWMDRANYKDYIGVAGDSSRPFAIQRAPFNAQRRFHSAVFMGPIANH